MQITSRAPLRLSLAGGGTDVEPYLSQFGSKVLNFTINLFVRGLCTTDSDQMGLKVNNIEFSSSNKRNNDIDNLFTSRLMKSLITKFPHRQLTNLNLSIQSPVSPGSGLGASSAVVVTAIGLLTKYFEEPLDLKKISKTAWEVERIEMQVAGGFQDQYSSTFGGFNLLTGNDPLDINVESIKLDDSFIREFEDSLLLVDLGISRDGAKVISKQIERSQEKNSQTLNALHSQKEIVDQMMTYLISSDIKGIGICLKEAWFAKKKFANNVSNELIDNVHNEYLNAGAYGAKLTGAGGGGHMLIMAPRTKRNELIELSSKLNLNLRDILITKEGFRCWNQ